MNVECTALARVKPGLSPTERIALAIGHACNRSRNAKRVAHWFNLGFTYRLVRLLSGSRVHTLGFEHVSRLDFSRGFLIAANHRTFFDLYLIMTALEPVVRRVRRMYFPVRSGFWYDSLLGVGVNAFASGMAMYPPIFRAAEKRETTRAGLDFLASQLREPGVLVGMHPEGTRSRGTDPYQLLGPEQSFGRVVLAANPVVLPVFVNGVGNSLLRECAEGLRGKAAPIVVAFGAPLDLSQFKAADPRRLRDQIAVGKHALGAIQALAAAERDYRSSLAARGTPA